MWGHYPGAVGGSRLSPKRQWDTCLASGSGVTCVTSARASAEGEGSCIRSTVLQASGLAKPLDMLTSGPGPLPCVNTAKTARATTVSTVQCTLHTNNNQKKTKQNNNHNDNIQNSSPGTSTTGSHIVDSASSNFIHAKVKEGETND